MSTTINYRDLSIAERIRLVQDIWDSIAEEGPSDAIPPWQQEILDRRLETLDQNPHSARPWNEVRQEIDAEFGR